MRLQKQARRYRHAEGLRCLEIDYGFELGRRLYRKISWLVATQDPVDVGRQHLCMGTGFGLTIVAANMRSTTASWRRWTAQNRPVKGEVMKPTATFRLWSLQNVFLLW